MEGVKVSFYVLTVSWKMQMQMQKILPLFKPRKPCKASRKAGKWVLHSIYIYPSWLISALSHPIRAK
jgi:hypothetical protein